MPICFGRGTKTRTLDTRFWRPLLYQLSYTPMKNPRFRKPIAVYHILSEKARAFFKKVKIFVQCRKRCESETGKEVCNNRKRLWRIHKEYTLFRSAEPSEQSLFFPFLLYSK